MRKEEKLLLENKINIIQELINQIYQEHFPNRRLPQVKVVFSNHLSDYNANIKHIPIFCKYEIKLNKNWLDSNELIIKGLLEYLIFKINKIKKKTFTQDLYDKFISNVHIAVEKNKIDPFLQELFEKNNKELFEEAIEQTNLVWGEVSKRTLGTYNYQNDTITISSILKNAPLHLIRFVVYHEMLHKKHKFYKAKTNTVHHSKDFRAEEKLFPNFINIDRELNDFLRYKRTVKTKKFNWKNLFNRF
ncbi:M48 family metallopeptidase [Candidatus Woesearchaeota archaeon]|nr:M48 family metallopeptidase [Candidatus Woesearchaeota archaeon]